MENNLLEILYLFISLISVFMAIFASSLLWVIGNQYKINNRLGEIWQILKRRK